MLRRGYPTSLLQGVHYDGERRLELLKKLRGRRQQNEQISGRGNSSAKSIDHMGNLLVLKCDYSPYVGKLRMYAEFRKLLQSLRAEVGEGFLRTGRLVITHPLHTNVFLETHAYNFPFAKQDGKKQGG